VGAVVIAAVASLGGSVESSFSRTSNDIAVSNSGTNGGNGGCPAGKS